MEHPIALPTFRCLPPRVRGIPVAFEILLFAAEIPNARFQENENPYFLPMRSTVSKVGDQSKLYSMRRDAVPRAKGDSTRLEVHDLKGRRFHEPDRFLVFAP